ncbi:hypothetical protein Tsubulata_012967 [Turnera subulata]|uniref:SGNH hydrolase-type esterase domain-containing protein n=1 Tax=Turnera subulata TaxID=218843 RepID=A0A9Q0FR13_9ROSI|nr:hypothetical protein Tsubulata_012967 [Turnera subulata]
MATGKIVILHLLAILMSVTGVAFPRLYSKRPSIEELGPYLPALFVMGDSSVDCGENTPFYTFFHRNLSLIPCFNGSDSTLLPHLLAKKMGLPAPASFNNQNGSVSGVMRGINFGSAQATIMNPGSRSHQSLNQQLRQVSETLQLLQLQLEDNAQRFIGSSIFFLSFGKDDYIDLFLSNYSGIMVKYTGPEFANILANQMIRAIKSLYDANARKIIYMGILPLGCTPRTVWEWHNSSAYAGGSGCVEEINDLVLQYNIVLEEKIAELNNKIAELNNKLPDAHIIFCDVYQPMMEVIHNPARYGFHDSKNACCGNGWRGGMIGCLTAEMTCNRPRNHVWWDLYNPTQALNSLLADSAWFGHLFSGICHPISVQDLVSISILHPT